MGVTMLLTYIERKACNCCEASFVALIQGQLCKLYLQHMHYMDNLKGLVSKMLQNIVRSSKGVRKKKFNLNSPLNWQLPQAQ